LVLEAGRPDPAKDGYVRVAGKSRETIYSISQYNFDRLFALGKSAGLFDLDGLTLSKDDIDRVELLRPAGDVVLAKKEGKWSVDRPTLDLETQNYTLETVATTLASWKPADYVDSPAGTGLDSPTQKVVVHLTSGESHVIELGDSSPALDGVYARLDGNPLTVVMARSDLNRVWLSPKDIYQRKLIDVSESEISRVELSKPEGAFVVTRAKGPNDEEVFQLNLAGATVGAEKDAVESFLTALTGFEASDILVGETQLNTPAEATLRVALEEGEQRTLDFGQEQDGSRRVLWVEKGIVFLAESEDVSQILIDGNTLKAAEESSESEPTASTTESEAKESPAESEATSAVSDETAAGASQDNADSQVNADSGQEVPVQSETTEEAPNSEDTVSNAISEGS